MKKVCCGSLGWVVLNAALWFGGGAATVHLASKGPEPEHTSAQVERIERAFAELDLSEQQEEQYKAVLVRFGEELVEARAKYHRRTQQIEIESQRELLEILSEEQRRRVPGLDP